MDKHPPPKWIKIGLMFYTRHLDSGLTMDRTTSFGAPSQRRCLLPIKSKRVSPLNSTNLFLMCKMGTTTLPPFWVVIRGEQRNFYHMVSTVVAAF